MSSTSTIVNDTLEIVNNNLNWNEHFTKLQGSSHVTRVCRLVDPTLDIEIENALRDILSKRSPDVQQQIKTLSMLSANVQPPDMTIDDFREQSRELEMEFKSPTEQYEFALSCYVENKLMDPASIRKKAKYVKWCTKAAKRGCIAAQDTLGWCYFSDYGVPADNKQGFEWTLKAAQGQDPPALRRIGWAYLGGFGTEQNLTLAYQYIAQQHEYYAAIPKAKRNKSVYFALGIYEKSQNRHATAVSLFETACQFNFAPAQYELALYLLDSNIPRAISLLHLSADQHFHAAIVKLQELNP